MSGSATVLFSPWEPVFARYPRIPAQFDAQFLRSPQESFVPVMAGRLNRVWHRPRCLGPIFRLLASRGILVASADANVAMSLTMVPRWDEQGRPYNLCARHFDFRAPENFDTIKFWDTRLDRLAEYVGRGRHLLVVWSTSYEGSDVLAFTTERIAIEVRGRRLWLPGWLWRAVIGTTHFVQRANPDGRTIDISLRLTQSILGDVFGYDGTFEVTRAARP